MPHIEHHFNWSSLDEKLDSWEFAQYINRKKEMNNSVLYLAGTATLICIGYALYPQEIQAAADYLLAEVDKGLEYAKAMIQFLKS